MFSSELSRCGVHYCMKYILSTLRCAYHQKRLRATDVNHLVNPLVRPNQRSLRDRPRTKRTLVHKQVFLRLSEFLQFPLESLHRSGRNHLLSQTIPSVDNPLRKKVLSDVPSKSFLNQFLRVAPCSFRTVYSERVPWNGRQSLRNLEQFDQVSTVSSLLQFQQIQPLQSPSILQALQPRHHSREPMLDLFQPLPVLHIVR